MVRAGHQDRGLRTVERPLALSAVLVSFFHMLREIFMLMPLGSVGGCLKNQSRPPEDVALMGNASSSACTM
jgi:hypothetical protein